MQAQNLLVSLSCPDDKMYFAAVSSCGVVHSPLYFEIIKLNFKSEKYITAIIIIITIIKLGPYLPITAKFRNKSRVSFFLLPRIVLFLVVSSRRHRLQMANEADEVLLGRRPR